MLIHSTLDLDTCHAEGVLPDLLRGLSQNTVKSTKGERNQAKLYSSQ